MSSRLRHQEDLGEKKTTFLPFLWRNYAKNPVPAKNILGWEQISYFAFKFKLDAVLSCPPHKNVSTQ
ncbi:hypothetical protein AVDCRST_MAG84-306 [uncultured Microcoleus sp.]|uniref:Uncharacterized protein n=1 Tax=uncultured Microcoleus sp. TaxID=259945 RepID=A0A6J4KEV5_9CYAN|nr:hypothetical protein AVDCRST_MAG84-306 [uncultured Microcoleus sp.]